jgi:hypothetical protein
MLMQFGDSIRPENQLRLAHFCTPTQIVLVALAYTTASSACEVRLKHPVPNCPAVTYGPEDCDDETFGKAGDIVTSPAAIHIMTSGHSYYCPSHEGCVEMKDLTFKGCTFTNVDRTPDESAEYASHIFVGDKAWSRKIQR